MSESFFRLSYNAFGRFCILVKQIAILYSKLRQEVRQMKRKDYHSVPETELSETTYELLSDEDFENLTN